MNKKQIVIIFGSVLFMLLVIIGIIRFLQSEITTQAEANVICNQLQNDVQQQVKQAGQYDILEHKTICKAFSDEAGFNDYKIHTLFKVIPTNSSGAQQDIESLADKLVAPNYKISVFNLNNPREMKPAVCIDAFMYLNNDGKVIPQGSVGASATYISSDSKVSETCF